jgi:hypothetical protein
MPPKLGVVNKAAVDRGVSNVFTKKSFANAKTVLITSSISWWTMPFQWEICYLSNFPFLSTK